MDDRKRKSFRKKLTFHPINSILLFLRPIRKAGNAAWVSPIIALRGLIAL